MSSTTEQLPKGPFEVVMLTTVHQATDDRIFHREAKTLADAGFSVAVIGCHSSSGYSENIWIEALPTSSHRFSRLLLQIQMLKRALKLGGKVFVFHDPELFFLAIILRLLGKKAVYDCHENLPMQVLQKHWIPRPLRTVVMPAVWLLEFLGSRMLSGVIVAAEVMQVRFPSKSTIMVRNFPTRSALQIMAKGEPPNRRGNISIYAGGLSPERGIREIVEAFRYVKSPGAELWLVGEFVTPEFQQEILAGLPPNVRWLGSMDHLQVLDLYKSVKVGLILHHPTPSHRNALPIKIFEYMGARLPIVASNFPEWGTILGDCGVQVDPFKVDQISKAIDDLLADESKVACMSNASQRKIADYCWEREGEKLTGFCACLLAA